MAYKKYIRKNGKLYGPYTYHSKRVGGKVVSEYHGKSTAKKVAKKTAKKSTPSSKTVVAKRPSPLARTLSHKHYRNFAVLAVILLFLLILTYFGVSVARSDGSFTTGQVTLDVASSYVEGEPIEGNFRILLLEGEFIPADSEVIVELNGERRVFYLSDLVADTPLVNSYYAQGADLVGEGEGYGVAGSRVVAQDVDFVLEVYSTPGNAPTAPQDEAPGQTDREDSPQPTSNGSDSRGGSDTPGSNTTNSEEPTGSQPSDTGSSDTPTPSEESPPDTSDTPSEESDASPGDVASEVDTQTTDTSETPTSSDESSPSDTVTSETPASTTSDSSSASSAPATSEGSDSSGSSAESSSDSSSASSDSADSGGASITGNVVQGFLGTVAQAFGSLPLTGQVTLQLDDTLSGSTSVDDSFTYTLAEGQTASLLAGSVHVEGETLPDSTVDVSQSGTTVTVSTDYGDRVSGYGEAYVTDEVGLELLIHLSELNISAEPGSLRIVLMSQDEELVSVSSTLDVTGEIVASNVTTQAIGEAIRLTSQLTTEEKTLLLAHFGNDSSLTTTRALVSSDGKHITLHYELDEGMYWADFTYPYAGNTTQELSDLIAYDKARWMKLIAKSLSDSSSEQVVLDSFVGASALANFSEGTTTIVRPSASEPAATEVAADTPLSTNTSTDVSEADNDTVTENVTETLDVNSSANSS